MFFSKNIMENRSVYIKRNPKSEIKRNALSRREQIVSNKRTQSTKGYSHRSTLFLAHCILLTDNYKDHMYLQFFGKDSLFGSPCESCMYNSSAFNSPIQIQDCNSLLHRIQLKIIKDLHNLLNELHTKKKLKVFLVFWEDTNRFLEGTLPMC